MPSGKNLDMSMPTLCFGEISRDEINTLLNIAGVSLSPPKKTPFATGIATRRKRVTTPIILQPQSRKFETVFVEPDEDEEEEVASMVIPTAIVSSPVISTPTPAPAPIIREHSAPVQQQQPEVKQIPARQQQQQQQKKQQGKKEQQQAKQSIPATTQPVPAATPVPAIAQAPNSTTATTNGAPATVATATTPTEPAPVTKPVVSSWAALLKKNESTSKDKEQQKKVMTNGKQAVKKSNSSPPTPAIQPQNKYSGIIDILEKYEPNYNSTLIQPRGLINNVNTCFMNVILQPLLHSAPFYNLIKTISNQTIQKLQSKTPLLDSIIEFINEFQLHKADVEEYGKPFVPEYVYNALRNQKKFDTLRGRQEDSEEFLCFLLDGLHEEMISLLKEDIKKKEIEDAGGSNEWLEVGNKNKTSNLRTLNVDESPVSKIFCGKLRSTLRCPGAKDSINQEIFQSLPLDISPDNVNTIEDAIMNMTVPETMHDYTNPKGIKVDATKQVLLERLPPVLILHMKRFVYDSASGEIQKVSKKVNYSSKLSIDPHWMVPSGKAYNYNLFGSVYHHGTSAGGGHYTCDIKRKSGEWLHIDDTTITSISEQDVLINDENTRVSEKLHADQTAYILFYVRS